MNQFLYITRHDEWFCVPIYHHWQFSGGLWDQGTSSSTKLFCKIIYLALKIPGINLFILSLLLLNWLHIPSGDSYLPCWTLSDTPLQQTFILSKMHWDRCNNWNSFTEHYYGSYINMVIRDQLGMGNGRWQLTIWAIGDILLSTPLGCTDVWQQYGSFKSLILLGDAYPLIWFALIWNQTRRGLLKTYFFFVVHFPKTRKPQWGLLNLYTWSMDNSRAT